MNDIVLSTPKLGFIIVTRGLLALGVGLLASRRLDPSRRRNVGRALVAAGALATIPAALFVIRGRHAANT
jgi:hypothetical protein